MKKKTIKLAELQKTNAVLSTSNAINIKGGIDPTHSATVIKDDCTGDIISNTGDWGDENSCD
jgi:hypothetical protein